MADHTHRSGDRASADRRWCIQSNAIFHSDHGAQYTSEEFKAFLASNDMVGSMEDKHGGIVFASLKNEFVYRTVFPTRRKAVSGIAHWIEIWYNRSRLHSGIGYRTPVEVHDSYRDKQAAGSPPPLRPVWRRPPPLVAPLGINENTVSAGISPTAPGPPSARLIDLLENAMYRPGTNVELVAPHGSHRS